MRRLLTVVTLGCVGAAALLAMRAVTTVGPAQISPFFVMVVIAPLTLRYATLARTYRRLFFDCFGVGMIMSVIMVGWFVFVRYPAHASWRAFVPPLVFLSLWIAFGSALAAALASRPTSVRGSAYRRSVLDTVAGAITVAVCFGLIWLGGTDWVRTLSWAVFEGFFFLAVAVAIYLPILFVAKRVLRLRGRLPFALFGAFLFPIPLLALPFLQGRIEAEWHLLLHSPVLVVWAAVPYLLGGAIVGWLVAAQDGESARVGFS